MTLIPNLLAYTLAWHTCCSLNALMFAWALWPRAESPAPGQRDEIFAQHLYEGDDRIRAWTLASTLPRHLAIINPPTTFTKHRK